MVGPNHEKRETLEGLFQKTNKPQNVRFFAPSNRKQVLPRLRRVLDESSELNLDIGSLAETY